MIEYIENTFCHSGLFETECPTPGEKSSADKLARNVYLKNPPVEDLIYAHEDYFEFANFIIEINSNNAEKYWESFDIQCINVSFIYNVELDNLVEFIQNNKDNIFASDCVKVSVDGFDWFGKIVYYLRENFPKIAGTVDALGFYIEFVMSDSYGFTDSVDDYTEEIHKIVNPLTSQVGFRVNDFTSL